MSNMTAAAAATGQSLLVKNSSHSVWPIIIELEPASRSGMTNSPTIGMKHNSAPAPTPGKDSGNVTSQNARSGDAPRSLAASSSEGSILASDLGASPLRAFWLVTFPLSLPGVGAGALLCFIPIVGEFV